MSLGHIAEYDNDCELREKAEISAGVPVVRLDLACGNNKKEGFIGVDLHRETQADLIINLEKYPWGMDSGDIRENNEKIKVMDTMQDAIDEACVIKESSVYEIHCSHYIEHVTDIISFMEELHRVLIPGGRATLYAPYYSSIRAWQDPTHKREISENIFLYYNRKWREYNKLAHYPIVCDFDILSTKFLYNNEWKMRSLEAKEWARRHNINVVDDIEVILQAIKTKT